MPAFLQEWHWIMSSQCNFFSVKEIYFDNLGLRTLWSIWMTGPLFLWPLVAGSKWFHESDTELSSYILLFLVFKVLSVLLCTPIKIFCPFLYHVQTIRVLPETVWCWLLLPFFKGNVPTQSDARLPSLKKSGVWLTTSLPRCWSDWMGISLGSNKPYLRYSREWMGQEEAWGEV